MYYSHDDVIKWKKIPAYWLFVRGIHRLPVNSAHKGQWRGALMFFFDLRQNKQLSKQSWGWWFETPSCPLWRHCNGFTWKYSKHTTHLVLLLKPRNYFLHICWKRKRNRKVCTEISVPPMVHDTLIDLSYNFNPWHIFYSRGICTYFFLWYDFMEANSYPEILISAPFHCLMSVSNILTLDVSRDLVKSRCYGILRDLVTHRVL